MHRKQHAREENSANPKLALCGRRCSFPLKCGQITKTTAGHLMTMGVLEPSCSIIEQANRWQWSLSSMIQHMLSIHVPPPSVLCAMPSICPHGPLRAGCDTVPPHGMLFLCAFHTPTSKGVVTLRTLIQGYIRAHIQRPSAQAHAIKGLKGPQKSVLGLGSHGKL